MILAGSSDIGLSACSQRPFCVVVVATALRAAHAAAALLIEPQRRLAAAVGKPKLVMPAPTAGGC